MDKSTENKNNEWFKDQMFWDKFAPFMFYQKRMEKSSEEVGNIIDLLDIQTSDKILDLCCGKGRHSLELARRGYYVDGVDLTRSYLNEAEKQKKEEKLDKVNFICSDMRDFSKPNTYDIALNMYTSIGYFGEVADDKKALENIYTSLKTGGKVIIETMGREILTRIFLKNNWVEMDGMFFLQERTPLEAWALMKNRWILIKDGEIFERNFTHRLYSATELRLLLESVGFGKTIAYGSFLGEDYDQYANRLVVVAYK